MKGAPGRLQAVLLPDPSGIEKKLFPGLDRVHDRLNGMLDIRLSEQYSVSKESVDDAKAQDGTDLIKTLVEQIREDIDKNEFGQFG